MVTIAECDYAIRVGGNADDTRATCYTIGTRCNALICNFVQIQVRIRSSIHSSIRSTSSSHLPNRIFPAATFIKAQPCHTLSFPTLLAS